jgi:hypothetical protein
LECAWSNTVAISEPFVDYVRDLKLADGGDIGVHGSIDVARSLLEAGLVAVIHLVVAPSLAGEGGRLRELAAVDRLDRLTIPVGHPQQLARASRVHFASALYDRVLDGPRHQESLYAEGTSADRKLSPSSPWTITAS